jgi:uncharacterized protein with ParB-like and HNH nuclease domain
MLFCFRRQKVWQADDAYDEERHYLCLMAVDNLLATSTVSLSDVIGNGKTYTVPPYQRNYSWKQNQWEDLWNDILAIEASGGVHYMGSIVLQNIGDRRYHVIDGQQRFSTLTFIVLAVIHQLSLLIQRGMDPDNNRERVSLLQKKFIGDKDPGSLTYSSKLKLNENIGHILPENGNENYLEDFPAAIYESVVYFLTTGLIIGGIVILSLPLAL